VKTKWEKCDLNTYQSTITDGVAQVLQNSIRNIEEDIIAMEKFIRKSRDWDLTLELSCHAGCPTVQIFVFFADSEIIWYQRMTLS
jgi:hypothetical protein